MRKRRLKRSKTATKRALWQHVLLFSSFRVAFCLFFSAFLFPIQATRYQSRVEGDRHLKSALERDKIDENARFSSNFQPFSLFLRSSILALRFFFLAMERRSRNASMRREIGAKQTREEENIKRKPFPSFFLLFPSFSRPSLPPPPLPSPPSPNPFPRQATPGSRTTAPRTTRTTSRCSAPTRPCTTC